MRVRVHKRHAQRGQGLSDVRYFEDQVRAQENDRHTLEADGMRYLHQAPHQVRAHGDAECSLGRERPAGEIGQITRGGAAGESGGEAGQSGGAAGESGGEAGSGRDQTRAGARAGSEHRLPDQTRGTGNPDRMQ